MVVLDLFSGAGGLSEGFWKIGCNFAAHVEMDKYACETLTTRTAYWKLKNINKLDIYYDYLQNKITRETLWQIAGVNEHTEIINKPIAENTYNEIVSTIHKNMNENKYSNIDVLVGGPPCQAYSNIGRSVMGDKVHGDHRNYLFQYYVNFLHEFKPKYFVFENVPGLKTAGGGEYYTRLMETLRKEYYVPDPVIHNSCDYGVLQNRKRYIIIGVNKDYLNKLNSKLSAQITHDLLKIEKVDMGNVQVFDLLQDLPALVPGESKNGFNAYTNASSKYLQASGLRNDDFNILTQHIARPHNQQDREIYEIAIKKAKKNERLRYPDLPQRLKTHKNEKSFIDRFKVVKEDEKFSHTILAHLAKDGHHFIHPDIKQKRSLSVREAARIQSFPDDFYFEGPRTAVLTQIGNAVPPLMAAQIAKKLQHLLFIDS